MLSYKQLYESLLEDYNRLHVKHLDLVIENDELKRKVDSYEERIEDVRTFCNDILNVLQNAGLV